VEASNDEVQLSVEIANRHKQYNKLNAYVWPRQLRLLSCSLSCVATRVQPVASDIIHRVKLKLICLWFNVLPLAGIRFEKARLACQLE